MRIASASQADVARKATENERDRTPSAWHQLNIHLPDGVDGVAGFACFACFDAIQYKIPGKTSIAEYCVANSPTEAVTPKLRTAPLMLNKRAQ